MQEENRPDLSPILGNSYKKCRRHRRSIRSEEATEMCEKIGFKTAGGRDIVVVSKPQNLFEDIFDPNKEGKQRKFNYLHKSIKSEDQLVELSDKKKQQNIFQGFDDLSCPDGGFMSALAVLKENLPNLADGVHLEKDEPPKIVNNLFKGENFDDLSCPDGGFMSASTVLKEKLPNPTDAVHLEMNELPKSVNNLFKGENFDDLSCVGTGFTSARKILKPNSTANFLKKPEVTNRSYKNLFEGENFDDLSYVEAETFARRKNIFQGENFDDLLPYQQESRKRRINDSFSEQPMKKARKRLGFATPDVKRCEANSTPLRSTLKSNFNCNLTPIPSLIDDNVSFKEPSKADVHNRIETIVKQLEILMEQKQALLEQANCETNGRILPGVLYKSKQNSINKILLKDLPIIESNPNHYLNKITPNNAKMVHFKCDQPVLMTKDGAKIVPTDNKIGLTEIQQSFNSIDGIDVKLVPENWVENHYKWIVWKLASYERRFDEKFQGSLCVENVIQQLKYRYDIEIDKVKRSALRQIYEQDECSKRRQILCVSNITKVDNSYELNLHDGWYSIRTIIDAPLNIQIAHGKIKVGTKLLIFGAELLEAQPCHPLEAPNELRLKINYNGTRRALWWSKLGFQQMPGPFLIRLSSVNMGGGKIGYIKCVISRIYPIKYMEKLGDRTVWRNQKAEERFGDDRNVTGLLRMKLFDDKEMELNLWRPTELHLQELKEGSCVSIYNINCSVKWGLVGSNHTVFKKESIKQENPCKRQLKQITELTSEKEFDTVAIVVEKTSFGESQQVWLSDVYKTLLLVKIPAPPNQILVLHNVEPGHTVAVSNLVLKRVFKTHSEALGSIAVIFARNPSQPYLQAGLEQLNENFVTIEKDSFLKECRQRIRQIENKDLSMEMQEMESSEITTTDKALLECIDSVILENY